MVTRDQAQRVCVRLSRRCGRCERFKEDLVVCEEDHDREEEESVVREERKKDGVRRGEMRS